MQPYLRRCVAQCLAERYAVIEKRSRLVHVNAEARADVQRFARCAQRQNGGLITIGAGSQRVGLAPVIQGPGNIDEAPSAEVALRMDCVHPCSGELDVTERLRGLPQGDWQTVRILLKCFAKAGTDMTQVNTPFVLATAGKMKLAFSDVRLVTLADGPAPCP